MGLEQRLEHYSFNHPVQQDFLSSALERLSQFVRDSLRLADRFRQPIQTAIQGITASALILACAPELLPHPIFAQSLTQSLTQSTEVAETSIITPLTQELSNRTTEEIVKPLAEKGVNIDLTGEPLTNAWIDEAGNRNIVFRNVWLQAGMEERLKLVDTPDRLNKLGLDDQLDAGFLGDPLPPRQDPAIEVGEEIKEFLSVLNSVLDIGPVVGYRNYGAFEVYRTPNAAIMRILAGPQANTFQLINVGYQALVAGLTPKEYTLSPLPFATGGGTTPTPEETAQLPSELFETTPQGRLGTEKFPEGEVGWKPRQESAAKTDEFFNQLDVKVIFKSNPNLRGGVGTWTLQPCETCTKTPERWGILKGVVDPADPRILIMEFNIFRPDFKLDPAWREQLADLTAGAVVGDLSKIIFGKSKDDLPQEQRNYMAQLSYRLQYEIRPLELIAPTTG